MTILAWWRRLESWELTSLLKLVKFLDGQQKEGAGDARRRVHSGCFRNLGEMKR